MKNNSPILFRVVMLMGLLLSALWIAITFKDYVRENPSALAKKINETLEMIRKERGR